MASWIRFLTPVVECMAKWMAFLISKSMTGWIRFWLSIWRRSGFKETDKFYISSILCGITEHAYDWQITEPYWFAVNPAEDACHKPLRRWRKFKKREKWYDLCLLYASHRYAGWILSAPRSLLDHLTFYFSFLSEPHRQYWLTDRNNFPKWTLSEHAN